MPHQVTYDVVVLNTAKSLSYQTSDSLVTLPKSSGQSGPKRLMLNGNDARNEMHPTPKMGYNKLCAIAVTELATGIEPATSLMCFC
eukprot:scaffold9206_cov72-Skeletonema_marinoi.AAC.1